MKQIDYLTDLPFRETISVPQCNIGVIRVAIMCGRNNRAERETRENPERLDQLESIYLSRSATEEECCRHGNEDGECTAVRRNRLANFCRNHPNSDLVVV